MKNILLTGATGFLGGELALRLLQKFPDDALFLLLRPQEGRSVAERFERLLHAWNLPLPRR